MDFMETLWLGLSCLSRARTAPDKRRQSNDFIEPAYPYSKVKAARLKLSNTSSPSRYFTIVGRSSEILESEIQDSHGIESENAVHQRELAGGHLKDKIRERENDTPVIASGLVEGSIYRHLGRADVSGWSSSHWFQLRTGATP